MSAQQQNEAKLCSKNLEQPFLGSSGWQQTALLTLALCLAGLHPYLGIWLGNEDVPS